jgi:hypothetical protein
MIISYLNRGLKPLTIVLAVTLLFVSCKKYELTVTELGNLAEAKLTEIKALSSDIPCSEQANVSIAEISTGCSTSLYPVKSSDLARFNLLKKEYFDLLGKQADAMVKQGIIIDPCFEFIWVTEQPIRVECKAGKVGLITSGNISIEEAKPLAMQTYEEIMTAVNAQTCSAGTWEATPLVKDKIMDVQYIPYLRTQDHSALKKKIALYNGLKLRIIQAEGPADFVPATLKVDKVECVDGKPVVKFLP